MTIATNRNQKGCHSFLNKNRIHLQQGFNSFFGYQLVANIIRQIISLLVSEQRLLYASTYRYLYFRNFIK